MLKKMFSKTTAPVSEYKEARDMHSAAFHIEKEQGKPLCGTTNSMCGTKPVTVEEVLNSLNKQHSGWYWCAGCGSAFTGEPKETFVATRHSRG